MFPPSFKNKNMCTCEMSSNVEPFAAVVAPGQGPSRAIKYKETIRN